MASALVETSNSGPLDRSSGYQCQTGSGQEQADVFRAHLSHDPVARLESPDNTWGKVVKADMYDHVHGSVSQSLFCDDHVQQVPTGHNDLCFVMVMFSSCKLDTMIFEVCSVL